MKRICFVIMTLLCTLLLCACGRGKQAIGQVTAYENSILSVKTWDGKSYDFQIDPLQTRILGLEDGETDPLGDGTDCRVQVTYSQKQGKYYAETVWVNGRLHRNAMALSDGTPIDVRERSGCREYCLEDGTVLLAEDNMEGLESDSGWNKLLNTENFPEEAQQGIRDYYAEMGKRYDIPTLLENAYLVYTFSEEYSSRFVSQSVDIEAWNDRIICCKMGLSIPLENSNGGGEYFYEGAVFDRQTGEHIPNYDLFAVTPEELEECILFQLDIPGMLGLDDAVDRESIALNLKPEQIVLCRDGDIAFYLVDRVEGDYSGMLQVDLSQGQAEMILKPWAVIEPAENQ